MVLQRFFTKLLLFFDSSSETFSKLSFLSFIDKHSASAASAELLLLYSREFSNQKIRQVEVVEVSERKQKLTLKNVRLKIRRL